ncbi:hypothetical protein [Streptomyces flavalbus]|uniref:Uncharacterized protein n=1 Tax=Streptomyces flavalbus TaxID=2665155 RepID=A0ABW2WA38_9ACTN
MAWDEWEQLKTAAAVRHTTQTRLGSGGGSGGLRSDKAVWGKAGTDVRELREDIAQALAKMADGQTGLGKAPGCLTAAAQREVCDSWSRYVKDVSERCDTLAELFEKVGNDQLRTDQAIKDEITKLRVQYEDSPSVGGQREGR